MIGGPTVASNAPYTEVRRVLPQYTKAALNAHYEWQVKVNFILGRDGVAHNIQIVNAPGYGMDQNIIEAMKQWLWDPVFIHEDQKVTLTVCLQTGPLDSGQRGLPYATPVMQLLAAPARSPSADL